MILSGIHDALAPAFEDKGIFTYSGFQNHTRIPYIHLAKISTNFEARDTCLSRLETNLIQISLFSKNFKNFNDDLSSVRDFLLYKKIVVPNRRLVNIDELELIRNEPEKSLYTGVFQYEVITQKEITPFELVDIEAVDIFEALYNRYTNTELAQKTTDFVTTRYGEGLRPILFIPEYNRVQDIMTTCTRIDSFDFAINFETKNFDQLEELTEDVDNLFSYTRFKLSGNDTFIDIDWLGNSFDEREPGLWESSTRYRVLLETNIAS